MSHKPTLAKEDNMSKNWSHKEDAFSPISQHPWRLRFRLSWQPELKWRLRETTGRHSTTHAQKHIFVQRRYTLRFFFLSFPSVSIHRPMNIVTAPTRVHNSCFWVTAFACRWTNAAIWNRWLAMHFGRKKNFLAWTTVNRKIVEALTVPPYSPYMCCWPSEYVDIKTLKETTGNCLTLSHRSPLLSLNHQM